ncbi:hypothetical protein I3760_08G120800 [Carya illinoinensis]|nr:hypothetical protein I3760_08G120800 [Carya illinoinensis]
MGTAPKSLNSLPFFFSNHLILDYRRVRHLSFHSSSTYYLRSVATKSTTRVREYGESPNQLLKYVRDQWQTGTFEYLDAALGLFDRMVRMHPLPSVVSFNQLLTSIARAKHHSAVITFVNQWTC